MRAEAQIAQADEALRTLFQRFKEDPSTPAFEELAEALLARGHASEALQIAEHGLQLRPNHPGGRIQRAAALLALGRTRVAYVELQRALAIDPHNRRGLRLLGRVYVDAGVPERAAALLARRHEQASPTIDARPLAEDDRKDHRVTEATLETPATGEPDIPELFASLTKDLGLAGRKELITSRIEVTQVMRLRRAESRDRDDELSSIEGPIVDTTQPGQLEIQETPPPGSFLFDVITSPQLSGLGAAEDEPLFNEAMPFAVRPVGGKDDRSADEDTLADDEPTPIDRLVLESAIASEAERLSGSGKTESEPIADEPKATPGSLPPAPEAPYLRRFDRARIAAREINSGASSSDSPPAAVVELIEPEIEGRRIGLALFGTLLLAAYLAGLAWFFRADLAVWMGVPPSVVGTSAPSPIAEGAAEP